MNEHEFRRLFPNATASAIRRNVDPEPDVANPVADMEQRSVDAAQGQDAGKETGAGRFRVVVTSIRKRLCDGPSSICEKWVVDCLVSAQIVPDDSFREIDLKVEQRLCGAGEPERTLLNVWKNPNP